MTKNVIPKMEVFDHYLRHFQDYGQFERSSFGKYFENKIGVAR
jgi:hypothetical protein